MSDRVSRYQTSIRWKGSTGLGWDDYDRAHAACAPPSEQELTLTTGEAMGDPRHLNPEQLVVMAAASCQMLWFLHLAAKARIDVVDYRDQSLGEMPLDSDPVRLERIELRPRITVRGDVSAERVRTLCETAHRNCFVANSLRSQISVEPTVEFAA